MKRGAFVVSCALALFTFGGQLESQVPTLPSGFFSQDVAPSGEWDGILGIAFAPDGRLFVIEKRGRVYIVENDFRLSTPFINLEKEVLNSGDKGLLGIALDPDFSSNRWVYLLYTVNPNSDGVDAEIPGYGRLTRYKAKSSDPNVADLSTRQVLLGAKWSSGFPSLSVTHSIGSIRFAPDGTLLLSAGEGAHPDGADSGGRDPSAFTAGRLPAEDDIGAFRSQWLGSMDGKILRIDPKTGEGIPSNPFYTGDPKDNASRVWAYGLRNPYRFTIRPGTSSTKPADGKPGTLYIGEVGWVTWEELNVSSRGGENFGWPCREGLKAQSDYVALSPAHHGCDSIGTPENPSSPKDPLVTWHHNTPSLSSIPGLQGKASAAVAFYSGTDYPSQYRGACFFADWERSWIRVARVNQKDELIQVLDFATSAGGPVDLVADPVSGDLYFVAIQTNQIRRIRYDATNHVPVAKAKGTPLTGKAPLSVRFESNSSSDPDDDALSIRWYFGDGGTSTEANPSHTYTSPGAYSATMTVDDGRGGQSSDVVSVTVSGSGGANTAPKPTIISPEANSLYLARAALSLNATATDAQDSIDKLEFTWEVLLHHNTHIHPDWLVLTGQNVRFFPGNHDDGTGVWMEIVLRVRDSGGLVGTERVFVYPDNQPLILDNGDRGTSFTGSWIVSGGFRPYGSDSVYSKTAGQTYTYELDLPKQGEYKVYGWWTTLDSRTAAAPYQIFHSFGSDTVLVDQQDLNTQDVWNYLGTYKFGKKAKIVIEAVGENLSTCADAICLLPSGPVNPVPVAHIDLVDPSPALRGTRISFSGHGDDNGSIASYLWTSSINGQLSRERSFSLKSLSVGVHTISLQVTDDQGSASSLDTTTLEVFQTADTPFHRGDPDDSGDLDLTDALYLLDYLYHGGPEPDCRESGDSNNDGGIDVSDVIVLLHVLFLGGAVIPPPGPPGDDCGLEPDPRDGSLGLGCSSYEHC